MIPYYRKNLGEIGESKHGYRGVSAQFQPPTYANGGGVEGVIVERQVLYWAYKKTACFSGETLKKLSSTVTGLCVVVVGTVLMLVYRRMLYFLASGWRIIHGGRRSGVLPPLSPARRTLSVLVLRKPRPQFANASVFLLRRILLPRTRWRSISTRARVKSLLSILRGRISAGRAHGTLPSPDGSFCARSLSSRTTTPRVAFR